jgi:hypothetical protein
MASIFTSSSILLNSDREKTVTADRPCSADHEQITTGNSSSLCVNLSVLCVSAVTASLHPLNRRDAEDAEVGAESF